MQFRSSAGSHLAGLAASILCLSCAPTADAPAAEGAITQQSVHRSVRRDTSVSLQTFGARLADQTDNEAVNPHRLAPPSGEEARSDDSTPTATARGVSPGAADIEQLTHGERPGPTLVESFDGLGYGFSGPQGTATLRNPSDNTLAVGPNHIVQIVNSRMAIFSRKGRRYQATGTALYGPVETRNVFRDFGGPCETRNTGDAVARYDQLANRWLIVMPIFTRVPPRQNEPSVGRSGEPARRSQPGQYGQPGVATPLFQPAPPPPDPPLTQPAAPATPPAAPTPAPQPAARPVQPQGSYGMCYAVSTGSDPFGPYYRYEFIRPLFPDYPRPAVWPDGYYVPTSTGDDVIQKHACVVERAKMLQGLEATEQCVIIDGVNFLNNVDLDGTQLPPPGSPNIMLATGGAQLNGDLDDDGVYAWTFHVDWKDPSRTMVNGPEKINVAPYNYLCGGQLTSCVPQPGTDRRLDAQGDKLMARVVYRRIGRQESIVAVHSVNTSAGGGGVRWYEFRVGAAPGRNIKLHQQGTYAPEGFYRWMASPAMDGRGNIGIGYSFGGTPHFAGQRFAGRRAADPPGTLTLRETTLAEGAASQQNTLRWEDYTQTAVDPLDDCTIWYVGDYLKEGAVNYSSRIGAFRMPGCPGGVR